MSYAVNIALCCIHILGLIFAIHVYQRAPRNYSQYLDMQFLSVCVALFALIGIIYDIVQILK